MYLEKWNNPENLLDQCRLNSNFDVEKDVQDLNSYIKKNALDKLPVKVKEYSEGHNILTLELPYFVLICECCFSISINFNRTDQSNLEIRNSKLENCNAFEVSFGENLIYCEILEIRKFNSNGYDAYEESLKVYRDLKNIEETAFGDGIEKVARNMIAEGMAYELISKMTGLSTERLDGLKATMGDS